MCFIIYNIYVSNGDNHSSPRKHESWCALAVFGYMDLYPYIS